MSASYAKLYTSNLSVTPVQIRQSGHSMTTLSGFLDLFDDFFDFRYQHGIFPPRVKIANANMAAAKE